MAPPSFITFRSEMRDRHEQRSAEARSLKMRPGRGP
jgi:hypothetical protein